MQTRGRKDARTAALAVAVAAVAAVTVPAAVAVDFDQGVDFKAVAAELRQAAASAPAAPLAAEAAERATLVSKTVTFRFGDASASEPVELESHVYRTECGVLYGRRHCTERLARVERRTVVVAFTGARVILPWETDAFIVTLQDKTVSIETARAANKYEFTHKPGTQLGSQPYVIEARATQKLRTAPDPNGLTIDALAQAQGTGLTLKLRDKWAAYYKGETTGIQVTLKREVPHWFDQVVLRASAKAEAGDSYSVDFSGLTPGQKYYVEWSFQREGKVSTDQWQSGGTTPRVEILAP